MGGISSAHLELAFYHIQHDDGRQAEQAARKAIALHAFHFSSWLYLGNSFMVQERWEEAVQAYDEVLKRNPSHENAVLSREYALRCLAEMRWGRR